MKNFKELEEKKNDLIERATVIVNGAESEKRELTDDEAPTSFFTMTTSLYRFIADCAKQLIYSIIYNCCIVVRIMVNKRHFFVGTLVNK